MFIEPNIYPVVRKFQGGRQRASFLQQTWKLWVKTSELSAQALMQQNDTLTQQNNSLSLQVHTLTQQSLSLTQQNDQLTSQIHSVTEQNDELTQQNLSLSQQSASLSEQVYSLAQINHSLSEKKQSLSQKIDSQKQQDSHVSMAKKPISEYSKSHQRRLKRKRKNNCEISLEWLKDQGLIPIQLTVRNIDTGDEEIIDMNVEEVKAIFGENFEDEEDEDFDTVNMMLMIKDTYQVSGNAYHEFARVSKQMPRHFRLKRRIAELNSLWKISPTPDGSGVRAAVTGGPPSRQINLFNQKNT